ncbi:MAG TPA: hypothetical protein VGD23_01400 [Sphingomicrobium sp.]
MAEIPEFSTPEERTDAAATLRAAAAILDDGRHEALVQELRMIADDLEVLGQ